MPARHNLRAAFFLFAVIVSSCGTVQFYEKQDEPVFLSNTEQLATDPPADSITVVSFNIAKAEKIQQAILELKQFEQTSPIDICLLQEMDEKGVQSIAGELKMNYLYIPIVYNRLLKKNIGNAILAKGSVDHYQKLIFPHKKWINGRRRHATIGEVTIRSKKILVYSVHTETSTMERKKRLDQLNTVLEHAKKQWDNYEKIVIGGDFNTLFPKDGVQATQLFGAAKFVWATAAAGTTASAFYGLVKPKEDYIFSKGLQLVRAGKMTGSKASDHYPIYAVFRDSTLHLAVDSQ